MKVGSLFSGYGGLDIAVERYFAAVKAWVSDIDPGACRILAHHWPDVPNLGDITKIDWGDVESVDILTGGFPCQDLSHAGKGAGMHEGTRSGLWSHMAKAISQLRPRYVVAENVRGLLSASATSDLEPCPWCLGGSTDGEPALRALGCVLGDLAELGYDAQWTGLRASDVGAPHGRFRVFIVAHRNAYGPDATTLGKIRGGTTAEPGRDRQVAPDPGCDAGRAWGITTSRQEDSGGSHGGAAGRSRASAVADPGSERHGRGQDGRMVGRVDGSSQGEARERERARQESGDRGSAIAWGNYEPAIRRWERVLGRPAPAPTEASPRGAQRLSPAFVEWMMGLPAGHVTDVPGLTRNAQLKALGNGVVPQQAFAALRIMAGQEMAA